MKPPDLLNNVPAPVRILCQPMLLISVVLHGVLLMLPIPSDLEKRVPPEEQVKVTQLPARESSGQSSVSNSPVRSSPQPTPTPQASVRPSPKPTPIPPAFPTPSQPTSHPFNQPFTNPTFYFPQSPSNPKVQSEVSQPDTKKSPSSTSQVSESPTSNPTGTETDDTNVEDPLEEFLKNFPFPENTNSGSLGILSQDADESARNINQPIGQVIDYYRKELPTRQYSVATPTTDDADLKIYSVSKGEASQYLHLISQGENTVIFLSAKQLSRDKLANLDVETAEEREFREIIRKVVKEVPIKKLTPDIESQLEEGGYKDFGIFPGKTPEDLGSEFSQVLRDKDFQVAPPMPLDKGVLIYGAKKNSFTGYIQLMPAGDGTAIIVLDKFSLSN